VSNTPAAAAPTASAHLISADRFQITGEIAEEVMAGASALLAMHGDRILGRIRPPQVRAATMSFCIPLQEDYVLQDGDLLSLALERDGVPVVLSSLPVQGQLAGAIDRCNEYLVRGWAANLNCPAQPLAVDIFLNGRHQGTAIANRSRSDLSRLERRLATTGFLFKFPKSLDMTVGGSLQITAKVRGTSAMLANSPWSILRRYSELPVLATE
jgi:hypothetical protein